MEPISDFSAAPHLPLSLRQAQPFEPRPELLLCILMEAPNGANIRVMERNGEIFVDFAVAA